MIWTSSAHAAWQLLAVNMGACVRVAIVLVAALGVMACGEARAEDPPAPEDLRTVAACLKTKESADRDRENCIGAVSSPCIGPDEGAKPPSDIIACFARERLVWDQLLNQAFRTMREGLDDKQRVRLRHMQRS